MQLQEAPRKGSLHRPTKATTAKHLEWFCTKAPRGEWCLYWTGFLWCDRELEPLTDAEDRRRAAANALGALAWTHYRSGSVLLVQRRIGHGRYEYFAVKRR